MTAATLLPAAPDGVVATTIDAMRLTASDLARLMDGRVDGGASAQPLTGITTDSRQVVPGGVFVAVPGEQDDGHRHVGDAVTRGATVAVVRADYAGPLPEVTVRVPDTAAALRRACRERLQELGCTVVGVTGSVGKTTAKEMCALALGGRAVARTPGNLNTWTGIPMTVLALDPPVDAFVAELAMSAPGEIRDLARMTRPRVGALLNVGMAHIGLLGSVEAIANAKAELLEELPADGTAVCNADDERVRAVAARSPAPLLWFGMHSDIAAYRAVDVRSDGAGARCTLVAPDGRAELRLDVPGEHALLDACAAAAVAGALGVGIAEAAERLHAFTPAAHRGAVVAGAGGCLVYDDCYNSSPTSLAAALDVLGDSGRARRVAVIGDMLELGAATRDAHIEAGRRAARAATDVVAVGEQAATVVAAAVSAGLPAEAGNAVADADEAAALVRPLCAADTAILVKGSRSLGLERVVEALRA